MLGMTLKIAMCQINPSVTDLKGNANKIIFLSNLAKENNSDVVLFPEMSLTGYPIEDIALSSEFYEKTVLELNRIMRETKQLKDLYIIFGTMGNAKNTSTANEAIKYANQAVVLKNGEIVLKYDKRILPNYGVYDELRIFSCGAKDATFICKNKKIALLICFDAWFPDMVLKNENADLVLSINASVYELGKKEKRLDVATKMVERHASPFIYLNQVGGQDDLVFDGSSFMMDANKNVVAKVPSWQEAMVVLDFANDMSVISKKVIKISDAPKVVQKLVLYKTKTTKNSRSSSELASDNQLLDMYSACIIGLRDYVQKNGFKSVVLGLSGGIDSALVATIAKDAVNSVYALLMPSMHSSKGSIDDALSAVNRLKIEHEIVNITSIYESYLAKTDMSQIAKENIQARIRGNLVMSFANTKNKCLALATGNKSEIALGYSTIYGDAAGGFAPIKDLTKTKVYELANFRNNVARELGVVEPIPQVSIDKAPSAELRAGQTDQDTLPEYSVIDAFIEHYIEKRMGLDEIVKLGIDAETAVKLRDMVNRAEWKRRQYPPGTKIMKIAFARDRRVPITRFE
jgi:NAD+ synthase (glutamine-hydrolysing)